MANPPPGWSAARPRPERPRTVVPAVCRVPNPAELAAAVAVEAGLEPGGGASPPRCLVAAALRPAHDRAAATLPATARAHIAAVAEASSSSSPTQSTRILHALTRLLVANPAVFGAGEGGAGAGAGAAGAAGGGLDPRVEAAIRAALAGAVVEACEEEEEEEEDGMGSGGLPGPVSVAVLVPGGGVCGATVCAAAPGGGEDGDGDGGPTTPAPPTIAVFNLSGALLAALPPRDAPVHTIPGAASSSLGPPTLLTRSGHAALPPDRPAAITVAAPGGDALRPADLASHLGSRLWGLTTIDAASVGEAGREALPLAWAHSTGQTSCQPSLAAATLVIGTAPQNTFTASDYGDDDEEDDMALDEAPEMKEFEGAGAEPWFAHGLGAG